MSALMKIVVVLAAFVAMEGVAWLTHKYIMHGLLWGLHRDHHKKEGYSFFEKNDFFFLIFAIPGMISIFIGSLNDFNAFFWIGLGITIYGFAYFLIHDVFIHQRFKWLRKTDSVYFRAIRRAHKMHHKHLDKEDGECFGMLWVPWKYIREESVRKTA
ncbi:MAG: sterol desaturase family protein [Flavisolibacter sp.]